MKKSTRGQKKDDKPKRDLEATRVDSKAAPGALEGDAKELENWADQHDHEAYQAALKLYPTIRKAYENMAEQSDRIEEYWSIYNAQPDENLQYSGNSPGYIPAVRDCINARAKRCLRRLFPANHKHVDGVTSDGSTPYTQLSLLEHYIRTTRLKAIVRSDLIAGDVTGQWSLMVDWFTSKRTVTKLVRRNPIVDQIDGENVADLDLEDPLAPEEEDTETEEVTEQGPDIVDFAIEDLAIIPPTCNELAKARAVVMRLRYSKERVEEMVEEGVFILPPGTEIDDFVKGDHGSIEKSNRAKKQAQDAGIKAQGTNQYALIFMAYTKLDLGGDAKEPAIVYYAGANDVIGIIRNPLWSGRVPIISEPIDRINGSAYGKSKIEPVKFLQWNLCDFWNLAMDSAMYSQLPVYAVDPLKTPQWAQLVMGLAAIWPVAPDGVKTITTPALWKDGAQICDLIKRQIWESMDVNEMMMGKMPAGRKNNQLMGQMQQEQSTNIDDHADRYEEVVLNPLVEMLFEFDQQFRTEDVTIESRGEIGVKAALEVIPPQQWGERIFFRWVGTAFEKNMQRLQQMIAWMNVAKGIPPQMLNGRKLDLTPILEAGAEGIFGAEMAPRILIDERNTFTIPPDMENSILHNGMPVHVHEADNDQQHIMAHQQAAQLTGDPMGIFRAHIMQHAAAIQTKREKQMAAQMPKGAPGTLGGGPPGAAGAPRPGAQPAPGGPRPAQNPPGAVQQDDMAGAPGRG